jgi:biopolymer transport protein TolR
MAFSVHGGKHGTISEMNVVPLIDILLVLLVIFMIVTPLTPVGLPAAVPQATDDSKTDPPPDVIVVQVLEDGSLRINQTPVQREDLQFRLEQIFKLRATRIAFVRGDDAVEFEKVAQVIDVMRTAGVDKVGLMTPQLEKNL